MRGAMIGLLAITAMSCQPGTAPQAAPHKSDPDHDFPSISSDDIARLRLGMSVYEAHDMLGPTMILSVPILYYADKKGDGMYWLIFYRGDDLHQTGLDRVYYVPKGSKTGRYVLPESKRGQPVTFPDDLSR